MSLLRSVSRLSALLVLFTLGSVAWGQTSNGTIAGVITDPSGAVVQNATVTATSNNTGEKRTATTNSAGAYRLESVAPGVYTISFTAANFSELKIEKVTVIASVVTTINGSMPIVAETSVVVEGTMPQLEREDGQISHSISTTEITNLPIGSLNPIALVLTEPGVVAPSGRESFTNGIGFSVNGTRPRANNFLIEGQDNNDAAIQGQALQVSNLEATKEVSILTNAYSAEFGHGGGSVTNLIYKSGTNTFHGSAFDLLQNSSLDTANAADKLNNASKPISRENTFGFTLGGPIQKDKIFIFGSIQWDKTRQTANGSTLILPTANGIAALQSLGPNPRIANYLQAIGSLQGQQGTPRTILIPLGSARPSVEVGPVTRSVGEPTNDTQYVVKGDYLITANDSLTLRYVYDTTNLTPDFFNLPGQLPGFETQQGGAAHNGGLTYTRIFTPHVVNEFRASYGRIGFSFLPTAQTLANPLANGPSTSISQITGFGAPGGIPQGRFHNTFQYQDSVSWNVGKHSFKFGADFARILVRDQIPFNSFGSLAYVSGGGFSALANYIDDFSGRGGSAAIAFGSPIIRPRYFFQNYFAEDTWKIRPNLTLSLGVRYENAGTPENSMPFPAVDHTLGANDPVFPNAVKQIGDNNNWAPRVSFAYTPHFAEKLFGHDKTVFRGGYGMYYDNLFTNIVDNTAASSPNVITPTVVGASGRGVAGLSTQFAGFTPVLNPRVAVTSIVNNLVAPITHQWNFDIERELPGRFVLTTSYVGTRGERLFANDQFNPLDPNTGLRVVPTRGPMTIRDNSGDSIYHALDLKLDRRFSHGLLLRTSYTYSKLIDDASEVFTTTGTSSFPADLTLGHRFVDRGLSAFDRRHRIVITYIYDIPKLKGDSGFAKGLGYITNGWQLAGTTSYQAGAPNTVSDGFDANGDGQSNDRPNIANPNAPITFWAIDSAQLGLPGGTLCDGPTAINLGTCKNTINGTPIAVNANNVHWIIPANGIGNLGRNTVISPGRQDWTFALQRTINLHAERQQLVFRTEIFNPFNTPNTGNAPFSLAGIALVPTNAVTPPVQSFGNYALTVAGERDIRFWMKYQF